ncbi:hypothetical protein GCK32_014669, partial [Trichostrongylus colubriformis]
MCNKRTPLNLHMPKATMRMHTIKMTSGTAPLDGWNYAGFLVETLLNAGFIPVFIGFTYICVTQKNFHVNFRATLFFVGVGHLIGAIHRLVLVTLRVCCIGKSDAPVV